VHIREVRHANVSIMSPYAHRQMVSIMQPWDTTLPGLLGHWTCGYHMVQRLLGTQRRDD
jgi:hypothetical protein